MRLFRQIGAVVGLAVAATLVAAPSQAAETAFYSVAYDSTLYLHEHDGDYTYAASYEEWQQAGFPAPTPAPVSYVKYAWSNDIWAVHFFGPDREDWIWAPLDFQQWTRAGRPAAREAGWIEGSTYWKYGSSPEIFVAIWEDEPAHKLTAREWQAAGSPAPENLWNEGVYKYPWSTSIGYLWDTPTGSGQPLTYDDWAFLGFPTPQAVTHVSNEFVWRYRGSSQIYLDSAITGHDFPLSYAQWSALGRPTPVVF